MFRNLSFNGVLVDAKGHKVSVECEFFPPIAAGTPAIVEVQAALPVNFRIDNPCQVTGEAGSATIKLKNLRYRFFPTENGNRKFGRIELSHIEAASIHYPAKKSDLLIISLSPAKFFSQHFKSTTIQYGKVPSQRAELFKINITGLGCVVFTKSWSIHHHEKTSPAAEIHAGYFAEIPLIDCEKKDVNSIVKIFRDVLLMLSVISRQAIAILGWEDRSHTIVEQTWLSPLAPNLPPYLHHGDTDELALPEEFEQCAERLINSYLSTEGKLRNRIKELSISIAPHIDIRLEQRFAIMFLAFERTVGLMKLTNDEKSRLKKSDAVLIEKLENAANSLENELGALKQDVTLRLEGFMKTIKSGGLSFSAKLKIFLEKYPSLNFHTSDLWPIEGDKDGPGFKEMRNSLTHGAPEEIEHQALAVAAWHFSIFIERLIFIVVGAPVPEGIAVDSVMLAREEWYRASYWQSSRKTAKKTK
jgi:hypothetical protein